MSGEEHVGGDGDAPASEDVKSKSEICRVCLAPGRSLVSLFMYRSASGSYAEILTTITNVQVSMNDGIMDKICNKCASFLDKAIKFKRVAEESDRKLRARSNKICQRTITKKISFDSFKQIKSEMASLNIKQEPVMEVEIEVLGVQTVPAVSADQNIKEKDIVICNTVIRKLDPSTNTVKKDEIPDYPIASLADISWKNIPKHEPCDDSNDADFYDGDFANDSDDDYLPLAVSRKEKHKKNKSKHKFKKPKLSEIKVFKEHRKRKSVCSKNVPKPIKEEITRNMSDNKDSEDRPNTYITCYPLLKNGSKGPPLILKRPKDATILKAHPNYKPRPSKDGHGESVIRISRMVRPATLKPREKHVCPICGVLTYGLGNHMATHSEKKRYPCPQCNRTFAQKNNMLIHLKTHTGVKDHICEVCGAGFYCQKSLLRHNLIHKGERPYGCTLCTKRFIARCDLTRHLRIHSGYKPFKCTECSMSFNAKHQLQNHERMHTGEKPYTCQVCNVAFSYKVNLNNHVYKVHGVNLKFKSIHTITEEVLRKEQVDIVVLSQPPTHILPDAPPQLSHQHIY